MAKNELAKEIGEGSAFTLTRKGPTLVSGLENHRKEKTTIRRTIAPLTVRFEKSQGVVRERGRDPPQVAHPPKSEITDCASRMNRGKEQPKKREVAELGRPS